MLVHTFFFFVFFLILKKITNLKNSKTKLDQKPQIIKIRQEYFNGELHKISLEIEYLTA